MARRRVTKTKKDDDRDITALCGSWGQRTSSDAISDIDNNYHSYYVQDSQYRTADVHVVDGPTRRYLRTDRNSSCSDNLNTLPDC